PALISVPFENGLRRAFDFAGAACLVAAVASWLSGERYVHQEPTVDALVDAGYLDETGRTAAGTQLEPAPVAVRVGESSPLSHSGRA
ncbi:MAG: hypothetical protein ACLQQM_00420, partial [Acidimicrobiales bacterium]